MTIADRISHKVLDYHISEKGFKSKGQNTQGELFDGQEIFKSGSSKGYEFEKHLYGLMHHKQFQNRIDEINNAMITLYSENLTAQINDLKSSYELQLEELRANYEEKLQEVETLNRENAQKDSTLQAYEKTIAEQKEKAMYDEKDLKSKDKMIQAFKKTIDLQKQRINKMRTSEMISNDFDSPDLSATDGIALSQHTIDLINSLWGKGKAITEGYTLKLKLENPKILINIKELYKGKIVDIRGINLYNMPFEENIYLAKLLKSSFPDNVNYFSLNIDSDESVAKLTDISFYFDGLCNAVGHVCTEVLINSFIMTESQLIQLIERSHKTKSLIFSNCQIIGEDSDYKISSEIKYNLSNLSLEGCRQSDSYERSLSIHQFESIVEAISNSDLKSSLNSINLKS